MNYKRIVEIADAAASARTSEEVKISRAEILAAVKTVSVELENARATVALLETRLARLAHLERVLFPVPPVYATKHERVAHKAVVRLEERKRRALLGMTNENVPMEIRQSVANIIDELMGG